MLFMSMFHLQELNIWPHLRALAQVTVVNPWILSEHQISSIGV